VSLGLACASDDQRTSPPLLAGVGWVLSGTVSLGVLGGGRQTRRVDVPVTTRVQRFVVAWTSTPTPTVSPAGVVPLGRQPVVSRALSTSKRRMGEPPEGVRRLRVCFRTGHQRQPASTGPPGWCYTGVKERARPRRAGRYEHAEPETLPRTGAWCAPNGPASGARGCTTIRCRKRCLAPRPLQAMLGAGEPATRSLGTRMTSRKERAASGRG
jgi:hypothetical protein